MKRKVESSFSFICLFSSFILALIIHFKRYKILPAYFSYDAKLIQSIAFDYDFGDSSSPASDAFHLIAKIISILHMSNKESFYGLICIIISFVVIVSVHIANRKVSQHLYILIIECAFIVLAALHYGIFSKDIVSLILLTIPFLLLCKYKYGDILLLFPFVTAVVVFRAYLLGVLGGYFICRFIFKKYISNRLIGGVLVLLTICVSCAVFVFKGDGSSVRTYLTFSRLVATNAADMFGGETYMYNIFYGKDNLFGAIINALSGLFQIIFPFRLLQTGRLYHLIIFIVFISFTLVFIYHFSAKFQKVSSVNKDLAINSVTSKCVSFIVAFIAVSALFEPDYGSVLRHFTFIIPIFVQMYYSLSASSVKSLNNL